MTYKERMKMLKEMAEDIKELKKITEEQVEMLQLMNEISKLEHVHGRWYE